MNPRGLGQQKRVEEGTLPTHRLQKRVSAGQQRAEGNRGEKHTGERTRNKQWPGEEISFRQRSKTSDRGTAQCALTGTLFLQTTEASRSKSNRERIDGSVYVCVCACAPLSTSFPLC